MAALELTAYFASEARRANHDLLRARRAGSERLVFSARAYRFAFMHAAKMTAGYWSRKILADVERVPRMEAAK